MSSVSPTTDLATTPVKEIGVRKKQEHCNQLYVPVDRWADYHSVYAWMVPLEGRQTDPLDILEQVATGLPTLRDTQEIFKRKTMGLNENLYQITNPALRLWGCTRYNNESTRSQQYRNPNYLHYETRTQPLTDMDERREFYELWKDTPTVKGEWFAHHFGVSQKAALNWITDQDEWMDRREQMIWNLKRFGRTIKTISVWTGKTIKEISALLPTPYNTTKSYVTRYANVEDWNPPEKPCQYPWFN